MGKMIFRIIRLSGLPFLFREILQKNKVSVLLFHDISKEIAGQTFNYLSKKYNIIHLNDFIEAIEKKDKNKIPKKALIITFDDAHIRNYEILPVIKKYNIPVTIFLCASIINTNRHFWFRFQNQLIPISILKDKSNKEKLDILSKMGFEKDKDFDKPQALQKSHIGEMKNYVNMQSHTLYHPCLPKCDNDEARTEIFNSKEILEHDYKLKINAISYPNGDYSERDILLAKEAGYKCGITVDYGFNTIKSDVFRLKRLSVNDTDDINELIVKASGVWAFFKTRNGRKQGFGFTNKIEE
jgi:peptidoglycan/xylan/chitin deacetylase (PgdA/CDA1 family)